MDRQNSNFKKLYFKQFHNLTILIL